MPLKNMIIGCGVILVLFLLYLVKVVYVDNVNRNLRYGDELDFNKPTKEQSTDEVSIDSEEGGCARNEDVPEFLPHAETDELLEKVKKTADVNADKCLS